LDSGNAFITIHSGAGGTEACDWADMLLRMYTRWCERKGYKVDTIDFQPGDDVGVRSVTLEVIGENAFGFLQCERGVHRFGAHLAVRRGRRSATRPLLPLT